MKPNSQIRCSLRLAALAVVVLFILIAPTSLFASACPFCYSQAAASSNRFLQALRSGIIILMVPPAIMSVGFTVMAYRRRNSFHSSR